MQSIIADHIFLSQPVSQQSLLPASTTEISTTKFVDTKRRDQSNDIISVDVTEFNANVPYCRNQRQNVESR